MHTYAAAPNDAVNQLGFMDVLVIQNVNSQRICKKHSAIIALCFLIKEILGSIYYRKGNFLI